MLHLLPAKYGCPLEAQTYCDRKDFSSDAEQKKKTMTDALGKIQRCVERYSTRKGYSGKLAGLFYRIWNAIKAIFCCSDWQIAKRAMSEYMKLVSEWDRGGTFWGANIIPVKESIGGTFKLLFPGKTCRLENPNDCLKALVALNEKMSQSPLTVIAGEILKRKHELWVTESLKKKLEWNYPKLIPDQARREEALRNLLPNQYPEDPPQKIQQGYDQLVKEFEALENAQAEDKKKILWRKGVDETFKKLFQPINDAYDNVLL